MQKKGYRIDLALFDDINSQMDKAFKLGDVMSPLIKIETDLKSSVKEYETAIKLIQDGIVKAKELGASDFVSSLNNMLSNAKGGLSLRQNTLKNVTSSINSL
jgi:hypothetical protein